MAQVTESERKEIIDRLRTVQGHLSGIEKMILEGRECEEILYQLTAIRAAVDKLTIKLAEHYLLYCRVSAEETGQTSDAAFRKALQTVLKLNH